MELALGTVQFGLPYGVAGRGVAVPEDEVRNILSVAWDAGIRMLDTAAVYGDIEERLRRLMGNLPFKVVTKIPPAPEGANEAEAAEWIEEALASAERNLGDSLHAVMFHRADDLFGGTARVLWQRGEDWAERRGCALGVSCYGPDALERLRATLPLRIAQLPANAFDQRLRQAGRHEGVEIHLRSAFLQGLLLMPRDDAARRVPSAREALKLWHSWLSRSGLDPVTAALGIVKGNVGATCCVVGVDDVEQIKAITAAWSAAPVLIEPALAVDDPGVIDPRLWPATQ